ncbi:GIY-YIG catalytic domain-containing protein [Toxoplasma gondii VAND]|uniref:GIY-YIG catalytic domain-containing protein n=1 Tax=Toxoplasma gondii VAND TaxID=933077 RepID=A0A086QM48_TOXGO|nr:GIY-YIG catalytic domain-containing protein [Toxoplasma gondii VAND]
MHGDNGDGLFSVGEALSASEGGEEGGRALERRRHELAAETRRPKSKRGLKKPSISPGCAAAEPFPRPQLEAFGRPATLTDDCVQRENEQTQDWRTKLIPLAARLEQQRQSKAGGGERLSRVVQTVETFVVDDEVEESLWTQCEGQRHLPKLAFFSKSSKPSSPGAPPNSTQGTGAFSLYISSSSPSSSSPSSSSPSRSSRLSLSSSSPSPSHSLCASSSSPCSAFSEAFRMEEVDSSLGRLPSSRASYLRRQQDACSAPSASPPRSEGQERMLGIEKDASSDSACSSPASPESECDESSSAATPKSKAAARLDLQATKSPANRGEAVAHPAHALQARSLYADTFHCVYLLRSLKNPRYTYVGYSVHPLNRLKQHNGETSHGGAWKTQRHRPWALVLVLHGFPTQIAALQFEWRWQRAAPALDFPPQRLSLLTAIRGATKRHLLSPLSRGSPSPESGTAREMKETSEKQGRRRGNRRRYGLPDGHKRGIGYRQPRENYRPSSTVSSDVSSCPSALSSSSSSSSPSFSSLSFPPFSPLSPFRASSSTFLSASAAPATRPATECLDTAGARQARADSLPAPVIESRLAGSLRNEVQGEERPKKKRSRRQPLQAQLEQQRDQAAGTAKTIAGMHATLACMHQTYKLSRTGGIVVCVGQRLRALLALLQAPPFSRMPLAIHVIDSHVATPFFRAVLRQRRELLPSTSQAVDSPARAPRLGGEAAADSTAGNGRLLEVHPAHAHRDSKPALLLPSDSGETASNSPSRQEPTFAQAGGRTPTGEQRRMQLASAQSPALSTWKAAGLWLAPHTSVSFGSAECLLPLITTASFGRPTKKRRHLAAHEVTRERKDETGGAGGTSGEARGTSEGLVRRLEGGTQRMAATGRQRGEDEEVIGCFDSEDDDMEPRRLSAREQIARERHEPFSVEDLERRLPGEPRRVAPPRPFSSRSLHRLTLRSAPSYSPPFSSALSPPASSLHSATSSSFPPAACEQGTEAPSRLACTVCLQAFTAGQRATQCAACGRFCHILCGARKAIREQSQQILSTETACNDEAEASGVDLSQREARSGEETQEEERGGNGGKADEKGGSKGAAPRRRRPDTRRESSCAKTETRLASGRLGGRESEDGQHVRGENNREGNEDKGDKETPETGDSPETERKGRERKERAKEGGKGEGDGSGDTVTTGFLLVPEALRCDKCGRIASWSEVLSRSVRFAFHHEAELNRGAQSGRMRRKKRDSGEGDR